MKTVPSHFVRTLGRTLRSAVSGYPTLGARGVASPSLTGPPLAALDPKYWDTKSRVSIPSDY